MACHFVAYMVDIPQSWLEHMFCSVCECVVPCSMCSACAIEEPHCLLVTSVNFTVPIKCFGVLAASSKRVMLAMYFLGGEIVGLVGGGGEH